MIEYKPCIKSIGPPDSKIAIVGEAPGEQEERTGIPFIGSAGQELDRMLTEAGFARRDCFLTNVFFTRPEANKIETFYVAKKDCGHSLPPMQAGKYLHPGLLPELDRLGRELRAHPRNLIIAMGNTACWAILGTYGISKLRGTVVASAFGKCLPTYHPSAVLRDWGLRPIVLADLMKARRESAFPEIRRPERWITINPTLEDVLAYEPIAMSAPILSVDVETKRGQITHLGIAHSISEALCVPFIGKGLHSRSYWNRDDEIIVRQTLRRILRSPVPKLFQHGMYDIQYLRREGYSIGGDIEDTMLIQHALYPELPKSLGFLGSIHTNEAAWKLMRQRGDELLKRDD